MTDLSHVQAVARQNPRRANEGAVQYIQRLRVLAGLLRPEETAGEPPGGWHDVAEVLDETPRDEWWQL